MYPEKSKGKTEDDELIISKKEYFLEFFVSGTFVAAFIAFEFFKIKSEWLQFFLNYISFLLPIIFLGLLIIKWFKYKSLERLFRVEMFTIITCLALLNINGDLQFSFWLASAHLLSTLLSSFGQVVERKETLTIPSIIGNISPAKIIFFSFFFFILFGTFMLMLPTSTKTGISLKFSDALFMSSSAVSTTGLATVSIPDDLSFFGQGVMLLLVQVGALGLMTFYSFLVLFMGRSMNLKEKLVLHDMLDTEHSEELLQLLIDIVVYTFVIEFWGGVVLTIAFVFNGFEFGEAVYHGFFHSVSAFCTAGFSTFGNSLENFKDNELINFTVSALCILGGLGFIVLQECRSYLLRKRKFAQFTLHSKVVIYSTGIFLFFGTVFIFFNEFLESMDQYTLWDKIQISFFQFMTAMTTAGFNTIPIGELHSSTLFFLLPVMFIGGGPGSTAGGIKITTFAIIVLSLKAFLLNENRVQVFKRRIDDVAITKTVAVVMVSLFFCSAFIVMIMLLEPNQNFLTLVFETLSSFGTVGISVGVTPFLSAPGKILLAILMFVARVGPLTLILAIGESNKNSGKVKYPEDLILIG